MPGKVSHQNQNQNHPAIDRITSGRELRRWYWLKTELAAEAKRVGIKCSGAKFTILNRICHFHDTGELTWPGEKSAQTASSFDWHSNLLTDKTVITDSYKNTQNVRRFFREYADPSFKFNIALMDWIRGNAGKTLGDAARYWQEQKALNQKPEIKRHNQFNQYIRDFMAGNPSLGIDQARKVWAKKKKQPSDSGSHRYEASDLKL